MTDNYIQLGKDNILRLGIKDQNDNDTGEWLEFQLDDIELPLRYQELVEKDRKNKEYLRNQILIIDKRQDVKGKKLFSKNEEDKIKALNEFFKRETEVYDMFLGKDGIKKLLNGQKLGWTSLAMIDDVIENQIKPFLDKNIVDITQQIKSKYQIKDENELK